MRNEALDKALKALEATPAKVKKVNEKELEFCWEITPRETKDEVWASVTVTEAAEKFMEAAPEYTNFEEAIKAKVEAWEGLNNGK